MSWTFQKLVKQLGQHLKSRKFIDNKKLKFLQWKHTDTEFSVERKSENMELVSVMYLKSEFTEEEAIFIEKVNGTFGIRTSSFYSD